MLLTEREINVRRHIFHMNMVTLCLRANRLDLEHRSWEVTRLSLHRGIKPHASQCSSYNTTWEPKELHVRVSIDVRLKLVQDSMRAHDIQAELSSLPRSDLPYSCAQGAGKRYL